jgi:hypothetical protein
VSGLLAGPGIHSKRGQIWMDTRALTNPWRRCWKRQRCCSTAGRWAGSPGECPRAWRQQGSEMVHANIIVLMEVESSPAYWMIDESRLKLVSQRE